MTKLSLAIFVLFIMTVSVFSVCSPKCASCGTKDSKDFCFVCQSSLWTNGDCTGTAPANCLYHSASGCLSCNKGFILSRDDFTCAPAGNNEIKNCIIQWSQQNQDKSYTYGCNVCDNSAPSKDQKSCSQDVPKNCLWGSIDVKQQTNCAKCASDNQLSVQGTCVGSYLAGCQISNNKSLCVQCLPGWNMTMPGVCSLNKISLEL